MRKLKDQGQLPSFCILVDGGYTLYREGNTQEKQVWGKAAELIIQGV